MERQKGLAQAPKATIPDHCAELDDPRAERARHHKLVDILAIAICATICGADSWVHIELFGRSQLAWFQSFLELPHGIPSHDTFGDVFARLDPAQLHSRVPSFPTCHCERSVAISLLEQSSLDSARLPRRCAPRNDKVGRHRAFPKSLPAVCNP